MATIHRTADPETSDELSWDLLKRAKSTRYFWYAVLSFIMGVAALLSGLGLAVFLGLSALTIALIFGAAAEARFYQIRHTQVRTEQSIEELINSTDHLSASISELSSSVNEARPELERLTSKLREHLQQCRKKEIWET
jgi:uncharacterized protein YlxW (UPF0749 family)